MYSFIYFISCYIVQYFITNTINITNIITTNNAEKYIKYIKNEKTYNKINK